MSIYWKLYIIKINAPCAVPVILYHSCHSYIFDIQLLKYLFGYIYLSSSAVHKYQVRVGGIKGIPLLVHETPCKHFIHACIVIRTLY